MIKKITAGEYLKDYRTMTAQEREAYRDRVGEWLRTAGERLLALTDRPMAKAQNLMMMSGRWERKDCEAAHEGTVLLTALMTVTETWLPSQLWVKSAWRAVRKLTDELSAMHNSQCTIHNGAGVQGAIGPNKQNDKPSKTQKDISAVSAVSAGQKKNLATELQGTLPAKVSTSLHPREGSGVGFLPVRPKHIDQYAYLLPKGTQERAGAVRGLLRDLDEAREKMRLLMEDVNAKPDARAAWARRATKIDSTLKGIYKELDAEWEKLVRDGRVGVDALGNAYVVDGGQSDRNTQSNQSSQSNPTELTSEQKARRRELRKWLIDLRRGKEGEAREKRIEQWKVNWKEYLMLEPLEAAMKDEKVVAAAEHFGVEINPDKQDDKQG